MSTIATRPSLPSAHWCVFTVQVQIFLVLLQTVTGLAVLYLPVAGTILG